MKFLKMQEIKWTFTSSFQNSHLYQIKILWQKKSTFIRYLLSVGSRVWKESRSLSNISKISRITLKQCGQVEKTQALILDWPGVSAQLSPGLIIELLCHVWITILTSLTCHETLIWYVSNAWQRWMFTKHESPALFVLARILEHGRWPVIRAHDP